MQNVNKLFITILNLILTQRDKINLLFKYICNDIINEQ